MFDQRKKDDNDKKYVEIDDHDYDEDYCVLVNRLIRATADTQLVGDLNFEDEMLRKLERDRINLGDAQVRLEEAEKKLAEKEMLLVEKDSQLSASIKMLSSVGIPPEQIAGNLKISVEIVNKLLK